MEFKFSNNLLQILKNRQILLDTNFFVDFSSGQKKSAFEQLVEVFKSKDIPLLVNDFIITEFSRGSVSAEKIKIQRDFIKSIVYQTLPITPDLFVKYIPQLVEEYREFGARVSLADFSLGAMVRKYKDLVLLTKNIKDFPSSIFSLIGYLLLPMNRSIEVYDIYDTKDST